MNHTCCKFFRAHHKFELPTTSSMLWKRLQNFFVPSWGYFKGWMWLKRGRFSTISRAVALQGPFRGGVQYKRILKIKILVLWSNAKTSPSIFWLKHVVHTTVLPMEKQSFTAAISSSTWITNFHTAFPQINFFAESFFLERHHCVYDRHDKNHPIVFPQVDNFWTFPHPTVEMSIEFSSGTQIVTGWFAAIRQQQRSKR